MNPGRPQHGQALALIERIAMRLAQEPAHIPGAGGNCAVKTDEGNLIVKASGTRMGRSGLNSWATVSIADGSLRPGSPRASIETDLHRLSPKTFTIHTHDIYAQALMLLDPSGKAARSCSPSTWAASSIPFFKPGPELARAAHDELGRSNGMAIFFGFHGLFWQGGDPEAFFQEIRGFHERAGELLGIPSDPDPTKETILRFSKLAWRINPDFCLFVGPDPETAIEKLLRNQADLAFLENLDAYAKIMDLVERNVGTRTVAQLATEQVGDLFSMPEETFRLAANASQAND